MMSDATAYAGYEQDFALTYVDAAGAALDATGWAGRAELVAADGGGAPVVLDYTAAGSDDTITIAMPADAGLYVLGVRLTDLAAREWYIAQSNVQVLAPVVAAT